MPPPAPERTAPPAPETLKIMPKPEVVEKQAPRVTPPTPVKKEVEKAKPTPPPKAVDTEALLAGIQTLSVQRQSIDLHPNSLLNRAIVTQAKGAARQVDIKVVEKSENVMDITLVTATDNRLFRVLLTAELKCPGPDGKPVTVWRKSEAIHDGNQPKGGLAAVVKVLQVEAGKFADEFFEQFSSDVRRARAKAGKAST